MITPDINGTTLLAFLLVMFRVGAFLWIAPPFGGKMLPVIVRTLLSVALALPMTSAALDASGGQLPTTTAGIIGSAIVQVALGAALGLACLTLLSAIQSAGMLLDLFGGFSLSQSFDPLLQQQNSVMGRVYQLLTGVLLLVTGCYAIILQGFSLTFQVVPLDAAMSMQSTSETLISSLAKMFVAALQIAGPLIAVLFLCDIALGLLTKVSPSLNAFSLGFPLKIGALLLLVAMALPMLNPALTGLSEEAVRAMARITGG